MFQPQHHSGYQQRIYKRAAAIKVFRYFLFTTARPFKPKAATRLAIFSIIAKVDKSGTSPLAQRFIFRPLSRSLLGLLRGIVYQMQSLAPAPIFRKAWLAPVPRIVGVTSKDEQVVMSIGLIPLVPHLHVEPLVSPP